jgi:micrococcal nuclease
MKGTVIRDVKLTKVVDGDTVKVQLQGEEESLRLACLDTEESWAGGSKPVTNAGKLASGWAKAYFGADDDGFPTQDVTVDIEFDTTDPVDVCLRKHRGNYGRLICYVYRGDENYSLRVVQEGWSPYFVKYGRSRLYHHELLKSEAGAQADGTAIWDPETNAGGKCRDYTTLVPWWYLRDSVVQDFRRSADLDVLSVRLDHQSIVQAATEGHEIVVFCDLQGGVNKWPGDGALIYAGSPHHKFNLWIPNRDSATSQAILRLIETRYAAHGRSYVYVSGKASMYPSNADGIPEIVLRDASQLSDIPPGMQG